MSRRPAADAAAACAEAASGASLQVRVRWRGPDAIAVQLLGELEAGTAELLAAVLANHGPARSVYLDLAGLTFLDRTGVQMILAEHQRLRACRTRLILTRVGARNRRQLHAAGLDQAIAAAPSHAAGRMACPDGP